MLLSPATFVVLAAQCAPSVHVDTLAAVAHAESRLDTLVIGDNTTRRSYQPRDPLAAVALAHRLLARGHSLDLGLMQVNSRNLRWLGLSVGDAFEPCRNIAAGAQVLVTSYSAPMLSVEQRPALLRAISRYNTGSTTRGFGNGYVARVETAARTILPLVRQALGSAPNLEAVAALAPPPSPPTWDVYRSAQYTKTRDGGYGIAQSSSPLPRRADAFVTAAMLRGGDVPPLAMSGVVQ